MSFNIYDLGALVLLKTDKANNTANSSNAPEIHHEFNLAIVNKDMVIFTDNEACHTVHNLDDKVCKFLTARQILSSTPYSVVDNVGSWVRTFGNRIEGNYKMLLKSIKEIGLNPKDFPRCPD